MLFYSVELLHVHITCLHVYYCLHIPSSLAQDARLCHGRGKDSRKPWRYPKSSSRLGFHGFGVAHAKGGLEVALPPNASILLRCVVSLGRHLTDLGVVASHLRGFVNNSPIPVSADILAKATLSRPCSGRKAAARRLSRTQDPTKGVFNFFNNSLRPKTGHRLPADLR